MEFNWDENKAESNFKKHDVSFQEATTVFADPLSWTFPDPDHSMDEERYIIIGLSNLNRLLIVSHTDQNDCVRLMSAREVTPREREIYEEE